MSAALLFVGGIWGLAILLLVYVKLFESHTDPERLEERYMEERP